MPKYFMKDLGEKTQKLTEKYIRPNVAEEREELECRQFQAAQLHEYVYFLRVFVMKIWVFSVDFMPKKLYNHHSGFGTQRFSVPQKRYAELYHK